MTSPLHPGYSRTSRPTYLRREVEKQLDVGGRKAGDAHLVAYGRVGLPAGHGREPERVWRRTRVARARREVVCPEVDQQSRGAPRRGEDVARAGDAAEDGPGRGGAVTV